MIKLKQIIINLFLFTILIIILSGVYSLVAAEVTFHAANRYFKAQQWEQAEKAFEEVLAWVPFSSQYLIGYGDFLWEQSHIQDNERAWAMIEPVYARAVALNPRSSECLIRLGQIQMANNKNEAAISNFKKALQLDPHGADTAYWMKQYKIIVTDSSF